MLKSQTAHQSLEGEHVHITFKIQHANEDFSSLLGQS